MLRLFGVAVISLLLSFAYTNLSSSEPDNWFRILPLSQAIFIFLCCFIFSKIEFPDIQDITFSDNSADNSQSNETPVKFSNLYPKRDGDTIRRNVTRSLRQFRFAWLITLLSWSVLYSLLFFQSYLTDSNQSLEFERYKLILLLITDTVNIISHTGLLACYLIFSKETTGDKNSTSSPFGWCAAIGVIGLVEIFLFAGFYSSSRKANISEETIILSLQLLLGFYGIIVGLLGTLIFGLFVVQLKDKHLNAPVWLIALLLCYAAIQPLYPVLHGVFKLLAQVNVSLAPIIEFSPTAVVGFAWAFKLILFIFVYFIIKSGRLQFYLIATRIINEAVDKRWNTFQELLKKNEKPVDLTDFEDIFKNN